jgi:hypothetical protein
MIHKFLVLFENKLVNNKFSVNLVNNKILISSVEMKDSIIKVLVYNNYNAIDYIPLCFPLEMVIYKDKVFNPYIILSSFNNKNDNELDFFNQINKIILEKYSMIFYDFNTLLQDHNHMFIRIMNENYLPNITIDYLTTPPHNLELFIKDFWFNVNIIKLYIIYILISFQNLTNKIIKEINTKWKIPKKLLLIANTLRLLKYDLFNLADIKMNYNMTLNEYYLHNFMSSLKLADIKPNYNYYILINKKEIEDITKTDSLKTEDIIYQNKIIQVNVKKVNKNVINILNGKNIIFDNYKWFYYYPNINIDKNYILFQTFRNTKIYIEIIQYLLNIDIIHCTKIIDYYENDNKLCNLVSISNVFNNFKDYLDDIAILKTNSYSDGFFEYVTKKYSADTNKIFEILNILFNNYNYPLKSNRHDMDTIFDYILYFSLYNYKTIFNEENNLSLIIPVKLKNLYVNLLKSLYQIINNEFESITYNQKFYNDYLYRNIIKLFFIDSSNLSIKLFKSLLYNSDQAKFDKFKNIVSVNMLLTDISNKLNWMNLPKKLSYLNFFYKNNDIVYYQGKINKNIISENFDNRIKKIIENPFEMYKYLRKEKDFIKWTKYISDKIIQLYYIPISLSTDDFEDIGKLLFLLFNITEQNIKDISYMNFINFCNLHNKLIINSNRINIKIR